jgi:hypothetical protein
MTTDHWIDIGLAKDLTASERAQWGLASLVIGSVLILAALITLIFNVVLWQSSPRSIQRILVFPATVLGLLLVLSLSVFGIVAGLKGRQQTFIDLPPSPLATAGVATGFTALILWLIVGTDLLVILA